MRLLMFIFPIIAASAPWNQRRHGFLDNLYDFFSVWGGDILLCLIPLVAIVVLWQYSSRYRRAESRRRRIESPRTKCFNCGYDLRSTRHRCPECGMPVTVRPTPDQVALTPGQKGPHVDRDFYMRIEDGTFWALELAGGHPVRALGPLPASVMNQDMKTLDFNEADDAREWNLTDFVRTREVDRRKLIHDIAGRERPRT